MEIWIILSKSLDIEKQNKLQNITYYGIIMIPFIFKTPKIMNNIFIYAISRHIYIHIYVYKYYRTI